MLRENAKRASGHGNAPWGTLLRSGRVWLLCWQYFFLSYGWYFNITWLPTYLQEFRGLDAAHAAKLAILPLLFGGFGSLISGMMRRKRTIAIAGMLGPCVKLMCALSPKRWLKAASNAAMP